jgi:hypothetical protein
VLVEQYDCDGVDGGDGNWDLPIQRSIVEFMIDTEGGCKCALVFWWRESERV